MADIDISKIKAGDRVRYKFQDASMVELGIEPKEETSKVYAHSINPFTLYVDGYGLLRHGLTILEHIPAKPWWADALVAKFGTVLYAHVGKEWVELGGHGRTYSEEEFYKYLENDPEIEVIIDKDGKLVKYLENPVTDGEIAALERLCDEQSKKISELQRELESKEPSDWMRGEDLLTSHEIPHGSVIQTSSGFIGVKIHRGIVLTGTTYVYRGSEVPKVRVIYKPKGNVE